MQDSVFQNNAVFFVEVDKVRPNPFQPRKEFDEEKLKDLANSIRMYGILQPLVVTRREFTKDDGGIGVEYEIIAGERRLRAAKLAGLREVPALIRSQEEDDRVKLELAIIENLQREDLNPVDRARSFQQLAEQFGMKHAEIAKKMGKSREYVSNSMRLLALPEEILTALGEKKISEGHTRPLLMLSDRPEEQMVLFKEIMLKKMTVRDAEKIARKVAFDKVRKKERMFDPEIVEMEQQVSDSLGTRVHIEQKEVGGRIQIDYFNEDDLRNILRVLNQKREEGEQVTAQDVSDAVSAATPLAVADTVHDTEKPAVPSENVPEFVVAQSETQSEQPVVSAPQSEVQSQLQVPQNEQTTEQTEEKNEEKTEDDDLEFSLKDFTV